MLNTSRPCSHPVRTPEFTVCRRHKRHHLPGIYLASWLGYVQVLSLGVPPGHTHPLPVSNVPSDPLWLKSQCRFWVSSASPMKLTLVPFQPQDFLLPTSFFNLRPVTPSLVHSQLRVTLAVLLMDTLPEPATPQKLNNYSQSKQKIHQQPKQPP